MAGRSDKEVDMKDKRRQMIKEYILITVAVVLMDIGIYVFKFPNNFSFGGVSGLAVVVTHFVPLRRLRLTWPSICSCWYSVFCFWAGILE